MQPAAGRPAGRGCPLPSCSLWLLCPPCRAPTVTQVVGSTTQISAAVTVSQPADKPAAGWASYEVTVCVKGADRAVPANCPIKNQACTFVAGGSTCALAGLEPNIQYDVEVRGAVRCSCACRPGRTAGGCHARVLLLLVAPLSLLPFHPHTHPRSNCRPWRSRAPRSARRLLLPPCRPWLTSERCSAAVCTLGHLFQSST